MNQIKESKQDDEYDEFDSISNDGIHESQYGK